MNNHAYFLLLSILCLVCSCSKANVLLKDAEKVNEDLIKMEIDVQSPV
jgi:hypothetical protein